VPLPGVEGRRERPRRQVVPSLHVGYVMGGATRCRRESSSWVTR
jgi:hypothetical protein